MMGVLHGETDESVSGAGSCEVSSGPPALGRRGLLRAIAATAAVRARPCIFMRKDSHNLGHERSRRTRMRGYNSVVIHFSGS